MKTKLLKKLRNRIYLSYGKYYNQLMLVNWYGKVIDNIFLGKKEKTKNYERILILREVKRKRMYRLYAIKSNINFK